MEDLEVQQYNKISSEYKIESTIYHYKLGYIIGLKEGIYHCFYRNINNIYNDIYRTPHYSKALTFISARLV